MPQLKFKNPFAAQGSGTDQQRQDLFVVTLALPQRLNVGGGVAGSNLWESEISFAVEQFPFPERTREMIPIKYMQQTNFMVGADSPTGAITIPVRWAFNRRTAEILERWHWAISNPRTGGVAISSAIKTDGYFYWLQPNMDKQFDVEDTSDADTMLFGPTYRLEGCLVQGLKPSDANMTASAGVTLQFGLQVDRYYPDTPDNLNADGSTRAFLDQLGL